MKAKIEILDKNKCWFFHKWKIENDNGYTIYMQCKKCKARKVIQPNKGYQPINWNWLNFKTDKI